MISLIVDMKHTNDRYINFSSIPPEGWIDSQGNLEAKYNRRRASHEYHNPTKKKKKAYHPDRADAKSESRPRVSRKRHKTNHGKSNQQNTTSHCGKQCYCVLYNNLG